MADREEPVKLKVAIGLGGGGCILEVIEGCPETKADADEYGGYLDDFFHNGTEPPKETGIYSFSGYAQGCWGSDSMLEYHGEFTRL